ncbi:MAG: hypothetical protein JOS17DRAFT_772147 [Linnemannia elongata]|nr:MAG: hypothetical protein JOS17DRAFT_772147 [Linnemannia elongata]
MTANKPVYFDESSASEEDDYDYDDGEYSSDGNSDSYDNPHSRHNSSHRRRTHRSNNALEYSDDDTDLVEHHRNKRGLASSPSYLDSAALNGRTTSGTDAYGYEQSMSREQADYRRSKEEEDEDLSYLSPVSGTRRFAKPSYPRGGLHSEPFYAPHPHLSHDEDLTHNQNLTDDTSDDEAYNEELYLKRYQLCDLPSVKTGGASGEATETVVSQLDVSSTSAKSPTSATLILDAICEEKEDDDNDPRIPPSLPSKTTATTGEKGGEPVSVSSSNNSLKESSRMGYSLHHAQPLQEANNQQSSSSTFSNFNNKSEKGERDSSYTFGAHSITSSPLPPLDSSSSSSSYQYHGQGQGQLEQEHRRGRGERYDGDEVRTDLDLGLHQETAIQLQHEQNSSQRDPTATVPRDTATPSLPPTLAPCPPKSSNDFLVVMDNDEREEHEEQGGERRRRRQSSHSRQGSTTLRKEMLSNVSQRVGDLDTRVNQMDALVSYKLTDIESKVQVLHDEQDTIATSEQPTSQETSTASSDPLPSMSFAEGEQHLATTLPARNPLRTSQLLSKATLLELRLELQAFGMRFHELNDALLTDLMTQMRQAKLMLFESTNIAPIDPITGAAVRRIDTAEAEMHSKLLGEIETRIQERVLAMEVTSARLEKCFDQMEARLGALEIVLVAGTGTGNGTGSTGTTTVLKRPRPESMYKILQQQQAQLQQREQRQQGLGFTHRSRQSSDSSSPESPTPDKFPSSTTASNSSSYNSNSITTTSSSSSLIHKPPTGVPLQQHPRAQRPTRILTTPVPHLLQQRTAPLSANPTSAITRIHRAHTLESRPPGPINLVPNGHINGPISAHPLSSSLPLARHHLLTTQRSMTALMAGPINNGGDPSSPIGPNDGVDNNTGGGGRRGKASGQKVIRRPSSYKELLHFWKAGGSTPDLLNTGDS